MRVSSNEVSLEEENESDADLLAAHSGTARVSRAPSELREADEGARQSISAESGDDLRCGAHGLARERSRPRLGRMRTEMATLTLGPVLDHICRRPVSAATSSSSESGER